MSKSIVRSLKQLQQELVFGSSCQKEHIVANDLINKVFAQFRSNLERIDSQGKQYFDHCFGVAVYLSLDQLLFVFIHHSFGEKFTSVTASF